MEINEMSFEQAVAELEGIIKKLEEGRLMLDDAVRAFERGSELRKFCEKKLEEAKLKIECLAEKS